MWWRHRRMCRRMISVRRFAGLRNCRWNSIMSIGNPVHNNLTDLAVKLISSYEARIFYLSNDRIPRIPPWFPARGPAYARAVYFLSRSTS